MARLRLSVLTTACAHQLIGGGHWRTRRSPSRILQILCLAFALVVVSAGTASANGGPSIASAPQLPIGQSVTSGWSAAADGEFWKVQLNAGDTLTINVTSLQGSDCSEGLPIFVYVPSVNDATFPTTAPSQYYVLNPTGSIQFIAPYAGDWIIDVGVEGETETGSSCNSVSYNFTASIQPFTGTAAANGAASIASAPQLPIGENVAAGWDGLSPADSIGDGEFWKVRLGAGDKLTLNATLTQQNPGCLSLDDHYMTFYFYAPSVNDATVGNAAVSQGFDIYPAGSGQFVAPYAGDWIIFVRDDCRGSVSFNFTANIVPFTGTAAANGAASIASAPQLPIGENVAAGWDGLSPADSFAYGEFWKVQLQARDKLTVAATLTQENPGCFESGLTFDLYAPSVNDATVRNAAVSQDFSISAAGSGQFVAPYAGDWIIFVQSSCVWSVSFNFTASLPHGTSPKHLTTASLSGPSKVRVHQLLTLTGRITGLSAGSVSIERDVDSRWESVAMVRVSSDGLFRWKTRPTRRGQYRYRVVFAGNGSHSGSQASHSVLVV